MKVDLVDEIYEDRREISDVKNVRDIFSGYIKMFDKKIENLESNPEKYGSHIRCDVKPERLKAKPPSNGYCGDAYYLDAYDTSSHGYI